MQGHSGERVRGRVSVRVKGLNIKSLLYLETENSIAPFL
jgi:hypothetical protein